MNIEATLKYRNRGQTLKRREAKAEEKHYDANSPERDLATFLLAAGGNVSSSSLCSSGGSTIAPIFSFLIGSERERNFPRHGILTRAAATAV